MVKGVGLDQALSHTKNDTDNAYNLVNDQWRMVFHSIRECWFTFMAYDNRKSIFNISMVANSHREANYYFKSNEIEQGGINYGNSNI